jgi:hypothetical protein
MPTISPARTSRADVAQVGAEGVVRGVRQPRQAQADLAAGLRRVVLAARQLGLPIIRRDRLAWSPAPGSTLAGDLAAAQHGAVWHSARISSSLWLM